MSPDFLRSVSFVISKQIEGGLSLDPEDRGNWTGGEQGKGELRGTKYGISAMRYPHLDIANLTLDDARNIYWRDYWCAYKCDQLPPKLAFAYFDTVVNMAPKYAVESLQKALGVKVDGDFGPVTLAKARVTDQSQSVPNFLAERAMAYVGLNQFPKYGRGWLERVVRLAAAVG